MTAVKYRQTEKLERAMNFMSRPVPGFETGFGDKYTLKEWDIGQRIGSLGIYAGTWVPPGLTKTFNLFAAPEDMKFAPSYNNMTATFNDTVKHVAELKGWRGHDGGFFESEATLYAALKGDVYKGEWFIPTKDILERLYQNKNLKAFRGNFIDVEKSNFSNTKEHANYYWSCMKLTTPVERAWSLHFMNGSASFFEQNDLLLSCRPVRVEPRHG